ncbi:MAG TPA: hypothetical protein VFT27_04315 [Actinomycetota bacterium]|nr:hypothetical protein [Actinomycetota bacterium]
MLWRAAAIVGLLAIVTSASPALAYVDRGTDPQEGREGVDIGRSTRRVHPTDHGRRLAVVIVPYALVFNSYSLQVYLDSRGGHRADFWASLDNTSGPLICRVYRVRQGRDEEVGRCRIIQRDPVNVGRIKARFPARYVHPNKRIRWRIVAVPLNANWSDRAPDRGWYPE